MATPKQQFMQQKYFEQDPQPHVKNSNFHIIQKN